MPAHWGWLDLNRRVGRATGVMRVPAPWASALRLMTLTVMMKWTCGCSCHKSPFLFFFVFFVSSRAFSNMHPRVVHVAGGASVGPPALNFFCFLGLVGSLVIPRDGGRDTRGNQWEVEQGTTITSICNAIERKG
jgi:hypothetical protein